MKKNAETVGDGVGTVSDEVDNVQPSEAVSPVQVRHLLIPLGVV